ncbi:gp53-like domain-containing protein [Phytobacter ursingii]
MYHVDNSTGVPVMPPVSPVLSALALYFTEGGSGVPPTYPGPDWFNIIQSELLNILAAAGIAPDKATQTQLLAAMKKLFLSRANPFADIKADGAAAVASALSNLGLGAIAGLGTPTGALNSGIIRIPMYNGTTVETLILQWMTAPALAAGGNATITFPTAFPNALLSLSATGGATAAGVPGINTFSIGATSCRIYNQSTSASTQAGAIWALGK